MCYYCEFLSHDFRVQLVFGVIHGMIDCGDSKLSRVLVGKVEVKVESAVQVLIGGLKGGAEDHVVHGVHVGDGGGPTLKR